MIGTEPPWLAFAIFSSTLDCMIVSLILNKIVVVVFNYSENKLKQASTLQKDA